MEPVATNLLAYDKIIGEYMKKPCLQFGLASLLGITALICSVPGCAQQNPPAPKPDRFILMDVNKDGKVVVEEFRAAFPNMNENAFSVIDINNDGVIEEAEWNQFMEGHSKSSRAGAPERGAPMNNIPGDPLIPPVDSNDLPLMRPPSE